MATTEAPTTPSSKVRWRLAKNDGRRSTRQNIQQRLNFQLQQLGIAADKSAQESRLRQCLKIIGLQCSNLTRRQFDLAHHVFHAQAHAFARCTKNRAYFHFGRWRQLVVRHHIHNRLNFIFR
jgi:hypothetical protein